MSETKMLGRGQYIKFQKKNETVAGDPKILDGIIQKVWPAMNSYTVESTCGDMYGTEFVHASDVISVVDDEEPSMDQILSSLQQAKPIEDDEPQDGRNEEFALSESAKRTNPKDAVGARKVPMSCVPSEVMMEIGLGMLEGAIKYGRHNYRIAGVRASIYFDAALRHLIAWWEGQDTDPDSGLSHITKALASLTVLRDAQINGMVFDDRPPPVSDPNWMARLNEIAGEIIDRHPVATHKRPFTRDDAPLEE